MIQVGLRRLLEGSNVRDAGVVYQNVDPPERAVEAAKNTRDLDSVGHVAGGGFATAASIPSPCHDPGGRGLVHVDGNDMSPPPGEQRSDGGANAGPGAGHDGDL